MTVILGASTFGSTNVPYPPYAGLVAAVTFNHTFKTEPAAGDIVEIGVLPQGLKLLDTTVVSDDIDTGAAVTFDVGMMTGEYALDDQTRTCGDEIIAASNIGQAGGVVRATKPSAFRLGVSNRERGVGLKIKTAPAGFQQGTVSVTLYYHAP